MIRFVPVLVLAALAAVVPPQSARADDSQQCTVSLVSCGQYITTSTESGVCLVMDLAETGSQKGKVYYRATFFFGARLGGEVLFIGGASAKAGVMITCKLPAGGDKKPDFEQLRRELPRILQASPEVKSRFPGMKSVDVPADLKFKPLSTTEIEKLKKAFPDHKAK